MTNPPKALSPTVLGLDVGMTATRVSLYKIEWKGDSDRQPFCVSCPTTEGVTEEHNSCNFPAIAYPFHTERDPTACLGFRTDTRSHPFPLKMFCYFLRTHYLKRKGKLDKLMAIRKRIPQLDYFWARLEKGDDAYQNRVIAHLHKIFIVHLQKVRDASASVARNKSMIVTKIAATLPPDWDIALQKIYENIVADVWSDVGGSNITLIFESEAVGHWLLRQDTQNIRQRRPEKIILADFGGHTLSSYVFDIVRGTDDESFAFFSSFGWEAECSLGGSELHSTLVKTKLETKIRQRRLTLTPDEVDQLISKCMLFYRTVARKTIDGQPFSLQGDLNSVPYDFQFRETEAKKMYEDCFKAGLPHLFRKFRKVAESSSNVVVILSGGSFLNKFVFDQTVKAIHDTGLEHLPWVEEMADAGRRPGIVSMGAAMALANELTIDEFMQNASFAIDTCRSSDSPLPVLLNNNGSHTVTVDLQGGSRRTDVYIVCAPLAPNPNSPHIPRHATYEFQMIDRHNNGTYSMSLHFEHGGNENQHCLVFRQQRLDSRKKSQVDERRWPIYYDPGSCVCFIDWDKVQQDTDQNQFVNSDVFSRPRRTIAQYRKIWQQEQTNLGVKYWQDSLDELDVEDWRQWIEQFNVHLRSPTQEHDSDWRNRNSQQASNMAASFNSHDATQNFSYRRASMAIMATGPLPLHAPMTGSSPGVTGVTLPLDSGRPIYELDASHQTETHQNLFTQTTVSSTQKRRAEVMDSRHPQCKRYLPS